jgi:hypothetical protein
MGNKLHAKFSASGSERWLECPGSVSLSEQAPPQKESVYALEGTTAHECLEVLMKHDGSGAIVKFLLKRYPETMVRHAQAFHEQVVELMPVGSKLLYETKVDLSFVEPRMFGTVDAAIIELFGTLWSIDYKYGAGRMVNPENNTQLIYYALGLAHEYHFNFDNVKLAIAQPRIVHKDGFFRVWEMDVPQLMEWTEKFREGVKRCKDPFAPLKPGRWCFFCPAQEICPAIRETRIEQAKSDFEDETDLIFDEVADELKYL